MESDCIRLFVLGRGARCTWQHACNDPYYPVMKDGIDSFIRRWRILQQRLSHGQYHYVSLGRAPAKKDRAVLSDLEPRNTEMFYVPVDMSAEMLRICLQPMNVLPFIRAFVASYSRCNWTSPLKRTSTN